ncbi:sister chromatid cohesion protein DCC1 [Culicoides brevitarsis]|uniref:sister chromatid cohesion protein DCC1 n=1 Tax=Culicoides brevitarsis TaxID=469753 RepID=UPI00307C3FA2
MSSQSSNPPELYERTLQDVNQMLKYAKIDKKNLTNINQAIYFPKDTGELENFMLLELNPNLLADVEKGEDFYLKGGLNEKAVLCSASKTYDIKIAEISNSLLLIPDLKLAQATSTSPIKSAQGGMNKSLEKSFEDDEEENEEPTSQFMPFDSIERREVKKVFHEYFECTLIKPRYRKTMDLLQLARYSGPENEHTINKKLLFTYNQLLDTAQCSDAEFTEGLKLHRAIDIEGFIRILDPAYEYRIVTLMVNLISENSWALDEIDEEVTIASLEGLAPEDVVTGLFNVYTEKSEKEGFFKYKEDAVSKILLMNILKPGLKFEYGEFMETWMNAMPEGMSINENVLKGIGIIDKTGNQEVVKSLNEEDMPTNIHDRLKILFRTKERWSLDEIEPYIEYFTTPQLSVTTILTKFARSLTVNGVRLYVSKH